MKSVVDGLMDYLDNVIKHGPQNGESQEEFNKRVERIEAELYDEQRAESDFGWESDWFASEMNDYDAWGNID